MVDSAKHNLMEELMWKRCLFGTVLCMSLGPAFLVLAAQGDDKAPGPLGLPSVETLKFRLLLTDPQTRKCTGVYEEYREKSREVEKKSDQQKKDMRSEIVSK